MAKRPLGTDVLTAARQRVSLIFDDFPRIYVSFSGGKDSAAILHLVLDEAKLRGRKVGVLFVDLEAQYDLTISYVTTVLEMYAENIDPYWVALPLNLRNAVSQFESQWICWDPAKHESWVRECPASAISDLRYFPFFREAMEFETFVARFGEWYAQGKLCACFVGIRADESLNRYRTVSRRKSTFAHRPWMTWLGGCTYNVYPLYDWATTDIWTYFGKSRNPYNPLYDLMYQAGLTIHQARICQPYGDDQRKGLWLFALIEPATWARVLTRVSGVNYGALYSLERGNVMGYRKLTKPTNLTWREFAELILRSMPPATAEHYRDNISKFLSLDRSTNYGDELADEGSMTSSHSWKRICRFLLRNDYSGKTLGLRQVTTNTQAKPIASQR